MNKRMRLGRIQLELSMLAQPVPLELRVLSVMVVVVWRRVVV
jgi:hypothetical protein